MEDKTDKVLSVSRAIREYFDALDAYNVEYMGTGSLSRRKLVKPNDPVAIRLRALQADNDCLRAALIAARDFVEYGSFPIGWSLDRLDEALSPERPRVSSPAAPS